MFSFSLDFSRLNADMLPPVKRLTRFKDLLFAFSSGINYVFQQFAGTEGLIDTMRDRVSFTGQIIYLEYLLRREFCGGLELIHIEDGVSLSKTFMTMDDETHPIYLTEDDEELEGYVPTYLFLDEEYNSNFDFIVNVDASVIFNKADMQALINYYKQAGKNYEINIV